jgi:tRNA threonylcarbamoyladenosine biosynthesis protein TsaB
LAATAKFTISDLNTEQLICPMIDARRMEVFTAVYDVKLEIELPPCAMDLNKFSFVNLMLNKKIYFLGNGSTKWATICPKNNAEFIDIDGNSLIMSELAWLKYSIKSFSNVAYTEPTYIKDFFSTIKT